MMRGILPAAVTPLDEAGRFLPAALEQLLERLYGAGVHGVYLCGSTGEGMLQSREQRQAIVETAMACTPRDRTVIVHVGAASLHEALALSSHAAKAGAHAISSLPPTSAQFSFADLRRYYEALAGGERPAARGLLLSRCGAGDRHRRTAGSAVRPAERDRREVHRLRSLPDGQSDAARPRRVQRPRRGARGRPADGRRRRHRDVLQPAAGAVRGDLRGGDRRPMGRRAGRPASRQHA